MTVGKKLGASFSLVLILVAGMAGYSVMTIRTFIANLEEYDRIQRQSDVAREMQLKVANVWQFFTDASLVVDAEVIALEAKPNYDDALALAELLRSEAAGNPTRIAAIDRILADLAPMWETGERMFAAYARSKTEGDVVMDEYDKACDRVIQNLAGVAADVEQEVEANLAGMKMRAAAMFRTVIGITIIVILISLVGALIITRQLSVAIGRLIATSHELSRGNLRIEPIEIQGRDELSELGSAFNDMLGAFKKLTAQAETIARGDLKAGILSEKIDGDLGGAFAVMVNVLRKLTAQAETIARGDLKAEILVEKIDGDLGVAFTRMTANLREIIGLLKNVADQIGAGANELLAATKQFETGSRQQGERANEVSSAVAEMSATVQQVAASAKAAEQVAVGAENAAGSGANVVNDTVGGLSEITAANEDAGGRVKRLGERGKEIAKIVNVISAITEQTNLLALNAAIEAARAGEHGKGFAVVADEVRKLAERSSASADEIRTIVDRIMEDIDATTTGMVKSTECGRQSIEMANQLKTTFGQIQGMVSDSRARISEIAVAVSQQALASDNISSSVDGISDVIRQSESATRQLLNQATELKGVTKELESAIGRFQV